MAWERPKPQPLYGVLNASHFGQQGSRYEACPGSYRLPVPENVANCPVCGKPVVLNRGGLIPRHKASSIEGGEG